VEKELVRAIKAEKRRMGRRVKLYEKYGEDDRNQGLLGPGHCRRVNGVGDDEPENDPRDCNKNSWVDEGREKVEVVLVRGMETTEKTSIGQNQLHTTNLEM